MSAGGFTVLLSTYNGEKYLKEQLDSILSQSVPPERLIVRDDGSSDGTLPILQSYEAEKKLVLLSGANIGFLESFHQLLLTAPAEGYFAFSDQDDVWLPDKLARAKAYLGAGDPSKPRLHHGAYRMTDAHLTLIRDFLPDQPPFSFRRALTENRCSGFALSGNAALRERMLSFDWARLDYHDWLAAALALGLGEAEFDKEIASLHRRLKTSVTADAAAKGWRWALDALKHDTNMKRRNVAFYERFGAELSPKNRALAAMFADFSLKSRLKKAFYPARWRYGFPDELAVRLAMLRGTL